MKKAILLSLLFVACAFTASAQKFALIDMEYILKNIPAYEQANNQLNQASQQYQAEIEAKAKEAEALYKDYQKTASSLSAAQKSPKRQNMRNYFDVCFSNTQVKTLISQPLFRSSSTTVFTRRSLALCPNELGSSRYVFLWLF